MMLRDEMWFVVEKIKVGGVAGSGECVRGHNLDRFGYWAGLRRARCTHLGDPFQLRYGSTFASEHSVTELFGHLKIRNIRRP